MSGSALVSRFRVLCTHHQEESIHGPRDFPETLRDLALPVSNTTCVASSLAGRQGMPSSLILSTLFLLSSPDVLHSTRHATRTATLTNPEEFVGMLTLRFSVLRTATTSFTLKLTNNSFVRRELYTLVRALVARVTSYRH